MTLLSSLTNRIFVAGALVVGTAIGLAIYRVDRAVATRAEAELGVGLDEAARLVDAVSRTQFLEFQTKGELIADLPVLKGAAATDDPPTVQPIAARYQERIGADLFLVLGRGDALLAQAGRVHVTPADVAAILAACQASRDGTAFHARSGGVLHVATIPLDTGLHRLVIGLALDREAADRIKSAAHAEVAFLQGSRVVASSLGRLHTATIPPASDGGAVTVQVDGVEYIGRFHPLGAVEGTDEVVALVMLSRSEQLAFLRQLRWQLAGTGLVAILAATIVGYLVARTVTRPLRALTGTMREMAVTGDLSRGLPPLGRWDDEDARVLATTFRQLTTSLDRFQREASMRERLSSLGRLSAVIAHEIRNPLMIIKSTVRGLRRHEAPEVVELATSIDEEVARVNRVVTGVLDFARPIALDLRTSSLDDIARTAVQAALASHDDVPVVFEDGTGPAPLVTDAEHLRTVLINLLTNAQEAVRSSGRPLAPVVLRTARLPGGWRIEVIDRGAGIAAGDLARVFDPFYTTRRTGSGLGLAISRNIIEGLGGTIVVDSEEGAGTTVRVELPHPAPPGEGIT